MPQSASTTSLALLTMIALAGCVACPQLVMPSATHAVRAGTVMAVRVAFPGAAARADVLDVATVSLIDPATGAGVASGVTDAEGAATLAPGARFAPASGQAFVLEALKRQGGSALLRLRTLVVWTAGGWTSVTGEAVVIDPLTTAIALESALAPGLLPASAAIGTVAIAGAGTALAPARLPSPEVEAAVRRLADKVGAHLAAAADPITALSSPGTSVGRGRTQELEIPPP